MASSVKIWALLVLSLSCVLVCCAQNEDYMRQLGYEILSEVKPDSVQIDEISVVGLEDQQGNKNADDSSTSTDVSMGNQDGESKEPPSTQRKVPCLGCPFDVDITIPENIKALHKLLEEPLSAMDSKSEFKFSTPNILSATRQVVNGIRYVITFEVRRTLCSTNDPPKSRDECPHQPEESRICVVELVDKLNGSQDFVFNNCTDAVSAEKDMSSKMWESHENAYHGSVPESNAEVRVPDLKSTNYIPSAEEQMEEFEEKVNNSQESEDAEEIEDVRVRRSSNFGALRDVDKSEQDLINQFAELAVKTLDEVDPDNSKRIVLGVTEAKKQIVNGIMYHLVIQVGTSTCHENDEGSLDTNCYENQLYPEKVCRVQIHRSWAEESPLNAKVVKSECADVWPDDFPYEPLPVPSERTRRSTQENWPSTDGWKKYELDDRSQGDCFDKVMTSFQDVLNVKDVSKVATIRDAHTRVNKESLQPEMVVTIVLTDSEKLRMMGDVKKPMVVSSRVVCTQRLRRSPGIPGGLNDADINDPYVKDITKFAMTEIQKSVNSPYKHALVRVVEARRQVVAGTLFHFKLEVAPTTCLKSDEQPNECTATTSNEQLIICTLKVWDQPWKQFREVQDLECSSSRSKRDLQKREEHVLGGLQAIDVEDPYVKELASFALTEIDKGLNSPYQQKVVRVVEAKTQVVAGTLMHLKLELATTNCSKSEKVSTENCVHDSEQATTMCSLKIWDRLWLKKRELQDLQCGRTRSKREVLGESAVPEYIEIDVKDPYIVDLATFALNELDSQTNSPYRHKLIRIEGAHLEHSSVTQAIMIFHAGYSTCRKPNQSNNCVLQSDGNMKICHAQVNDRPWIPHSKVLVSLKCSPFVGGNPHPPPNHPLIGGDDVDFAAASFRQFRKSYNKTYHSDEELQKRFHIFKANLKLIGLLQAGEQGTAVYGPTIFADLSPEEFKEKYLGLRQDLRQENAVPMQKAHIPNIRLPTSFDWRDHNVVTPVKNQGACGSCWAFSVTGNLEGQYAIKHGNLLSLSEQELIDCDTLDDGCKGGLPENAYHALEQLGGIETESDYPYEGDDEQCHFNLTDAMVNVKSSVNITTDEASMAKWLVKNGPIAIGINANAMQFYVGGVSHPFKFLCSPGNLDHGVLIVGYGVHTTSIRHKVLPYWLIKNSWGTFWGEKGYYRVYRGDGTCGVNQMASSAVIE